MFRAAGGARVITDATTRPVASTSVRDVVALTKPRITALVLCTTAGGLFLAHGHIARVTTLVALVATTLAVGAANALNCYIERDLDRHMARTRNRPLPAGRMAPQVALAVGLVLAAVSIPALWFGVNPVTGLLGALALGSYVLVYTPMKTRSPAALLVGAVPGALPPLMGWTAVTGRVEVPGLVLFAILFLWQLPHFLAIATFRRDDYARAGMKVMPLVRTERAVRWHIVLYTLALVPISILLVPLHVAGMGYLVVATLLGAVFLAWSLAGFRPAAGNVWARKLFVVSLVYLTGLFAALMLNAV